MSLRTTYCHELTIARPLLKEHTSLKATMGESLEFIRSVKTQATPALDIFIIARRALPGGEIRARYTS
jgi:hypothetical protein